MPRVAIQDMKSSLSFNGSSTVVTTSVTPLITGFGFGFWTKLGNPAARCLVSWSNNFTPSQGFRLVTEGGSTNNMYAAISDSGGTKYCDTAKVTSYMGQWIFIAFTHVQGAQKIYVNGALLDTTNGTMVDAVGQTLTFGRNSYTASEYYNGIMSNIVFQNTTTPWTQAQITELYNNGTIPSGATQVLPLSEGAGSTAYDSSGNGNNGTITSGTYVLDTPTKIRKQVNGNLVYNGDFEYAPPTNVACTTTSVWLDGTSGGSATNSNFGWLTYTGGANQPALFDSSISHSGRYSLKISTTAINTAAQVANCLNTSSSVNGLNSIRAIPVLPNTSYTVTGWIKTTVNSGTAGSGAQIGVRETTAAGTQAAITLLGNVIATTDWTQYIATFTTNAATRYIIIRPAVVGNDGTGTLIMDAWFDDIELRPTIPVVRAVATGRLPAGPRTAVT